MTKRVTVEVVGFTNVRTGSDAGGNLEIYGHLGAWKIGRDFGGTPVNRGQWLGWDFQNDGSAVSVGEGGFFRIAEVSPAFPIESDEELWVGGHLKEDDAPPNNNDSLGDRHKKIRHDNIRNGEQTVRFDDGDQFVDALFKITVV